MAPELQENQVNEYALVIRGKRDFGQCRAGIVTLTA
jgi:hypothetical protein